MKSVARILLSRTTEVIWYRGEEYADKGRVKIVRYDDKEIKAIVMGTEKYRVSLKFVTNGIRRNCNCPYSKGICKHIVATAIIWDELRGVDRPNRKEIKENSIPATSDIRSKIGVLFAKPLKADLNSIRIMVHYVAFPSKRKARHALLPNCPKISMDTKSPLEVKEVERALKEMEKWSRRSSYDRYFCAGEMAAAFCELLDVIEFRSSNSSPGEMISIMARCIEWYYKTFLDIIDGSDGVWIFPVARIGRNVDSLKRMYPSDGKWEEFDDIVCDVASGWDADTVNSDFIASWKDSSL